MFVGHEFVAFGVATLAAARVGRTPKTALTVGAVAGAVALLPDLDVAIGAVSYLRLLGDGATLSMNGFWGVSNGIHRQVTHSLPVGGIAAVAFTVVAVLRRSWRGARGRLLAASAVALLSMGAVSVIALDASGVRGLVVAATFLAGVVVAGSIAATHTALSTGELLGAAAIGFLTHPFGDVLMASPPPLLAPWNVSLLDERVRLAADPTLNLLGITFAELAAVWFGIGASLVVSRRSLRDFVAPRAVLGLGYALAVFFVPRPTMADAHWLGFTIAPLAAVGLPSVRRDGWTLASSVRAVVTGLVTITLAAVAYTLVYVATAS